MNLYTFPRGQCRWDLCSMERVVSAEIPVSKVKKIRIGQIATTCTPNSTVLNDSEPSVARDVPLTGRRCLPIRGSRLWDLSIATYCAIAALRTRPPVGPVLFPHSAGRPAGPGASPVGSARLQTMIAGIYSICGIKCQGLQSRMKTCGTQVSLRRERPRTSGRWFPRRISLVQPFMVTRTSSSDPDFGKHDLFL